MDRLPPLLDAESGSDLAQIIASARRMVPELAVLLIEPVLDALTALHQSGLVMGGCSASSIWLSPEGDISLLGEGKAASTPYAVHQDQRAVAALLYTMVSGAQPSTTGRLLPPQSLSSAVEEPLSQAIVQALGGGFNSLAVFKKVLFGALPYHFALERRSAFIVQLVADPAIAAKMIANEAAQLWTTAGFEILNSGDCAQARRAAEAALARAPGNTRAAELLRMVGSDANAFLGMADTLEADRKVINVLVAAAPESALADTADFAAVARRVPHTTPKKNQLSGPLIVLLSALVAGLIGAGITWMVRNLHGRHAEAPAPEIALPITPDVPQSTASKSIPKR